MKYISLFSGIGGFDLGFDRAGMECVLQVEKDDKARAVLAHHWPNVPRMELVEDVTRDKIRELGIETVDLLCGGFPCQDLSVAGQRKGLAGERSGLWFEFLRVIKELRPEWVVIENVPGLLSSDSGRDMGTILNGLGQCGYWWAYRVLDAQYFGVPQRRRRVFIVASLRKFAPQEILFERDSSPWDTPPGREKGARIADPITRSFAASRGSTAGNNGKPINLLVANGYSESGPGWWREGVGTLRERDYKDGNSGLVTITNAFNGYTGGADDNDAQGNHLVIGFAHTSTIDYAEELSPPVTLSSGLEIPSPPKVSDKNGVRRLTPLECERLQGFPDYWTDIGQSDSARYRQLGNAVCMPVAEWIGRRIAAL